MGCRFIDAVQNQTSICRSSPTLISVINQTERLTELISSIPSNKLLKGDFYIFNKV